MNGALAVEPLHAATSVAKDRGGRAAFLATLGIFAILYAMGMAVGHGCAVEPGHIVLFWLPSGLYLGTLLTTPVRRWPVFMATALVVTAVVNVAWRDKPIVVGVGFGLATLVEASTAAFVLRRLLGSKPRCDRIRDVFCVAVVGLLFAAPLGALIGAGTAWWHLYGPFGRELRCWWLGDVLGIVIFAPPLLALGRIWEEGVPHVNFRWAAELAIVCGLMGVVGWIVYGAPPGTPLPGAIFFPLFIWTAARFGAPGMSLALLLLTPIAAYMTAAGLGPTAHIALPEGRALMLQVVLIGYGMTGWILTALWHELSESLDAQRTANNDLELQVARRTERLRTSEARYRASFHVTNVGKMEVDAETRRFILVNDAYCTIVGWSREELLAMGPADLAHPGDDVWDGPIVAAFFRGERDHYSAEKRFIRKDGKDVWVRVNCGLVRDAAGKPLHSVGVLEDITNRKKSEEALKEADRRKDEFLATLAHELRNPLAPIRNGLQLMKLAKNDDHALECARSMMERQVAQMVRLVDDLLDVSRITRGKVELKRRRATLADVVQQAVETSRPWIESARHALSVELPAETIFLYADADRLAQVLANLLNNAAKYMAPEGTIVLRAWRDGTQIALSVKDSGIGIPTEMLPKVFDLFAQVDHSLEKAQGGLGIGLSLAKGLVEMHHGTIEAYSQGAGQGSEFVVRLPGEDASQDAPALSAPAGEHRSSERPSRRILVVDDNRDAAVSLAMMLRRMGGETRTAHDGMEAVAVAASFRPDIVLLDIGMPRLNGYDACRRIRAAPWGKTIKLVALTGWGQEEDRRRSAEAGFDFHFVKPIDLDALVQLWEA